MKNASTEDNLLQSASAAGTWDEPRKLWEGKPRRTLSSLNLLWCILAAPSHLGMQAETDVAPVRRILIESSFCTPAEIIFNPAQGEQRHSLCELALPASFSGPGWQILSDRLTWVVLTKGFSFSSLFFFDSENYSTLINPNPTLGMQCFGCC